MSREIKFRARGNFNNKWYYGYYFKNELSERHYIQISREKDNIECYEIDIDTLGQFTGLKDSKGVEIYDGDVVEISQMAHGSKKTKVVFENFMYKFISLDEDRLWHFSDISTNMNLKIIGNIYETPDLLNN